MKSELFHSTFTVTELDPYGKKFDRVSRITALSETNDIEITLDVNTEIYPLGVQDKLVFSLASTLALDGNAASADTLSRDAWRATGPSLADDYDYVMFGKVYKYDDSGPDKVSVYASFGGLLLCISGDYRRLQDLDVGMEVYLLMKK